MIAFVLANDDTAPTGPAGWTKLDDDLMSADHFRSQVWYVVATSTQTAATNFTWTDTVGPNSPMTAAISAYRGVDQGSPINVGTQSTFDTSGLSAVAGPSATLTSTSWTIHYRCVRASAVSSPVIATFTGAGTERFDVGNHGGTVAYSHTAHDTNAEDAAGTVTGMTLTATTSSTISDSMSRTIALADADTSVTSGVASATGVALDVGYGITAGVASATGSGVDVSFTPVVNSSSTGTASDATPALGGAALTAGATATALDASVAIGVSAGIASAIGAALDAPLSFVAAGLAAPNAVALDATVKITANAAVASAVATATNSLPYFGAPLARTYKIDTEVRTKSTDAESRGYSINQELRLKVVGSVDAG